MLKTIKIMAKKIKLTKDDVRKIVTESVNEILREMDESNVYTMDNWEKDGTLNLKIGQVISPEVYTRLLNAMPPEANTRLYFQPGEAYSHDFNTGKALFMTFKSVGDNYYKYIGLKPSVYDEAIKESVSKVLSELDWRTLDMAADKASKMTDRVDLDDYEKERRSNQARAFKKASSSAYDKHYGLDKINKRRNEYIDDVIRAGLNPSRVEPFKHTQGELKRLSRSIKDLNDFYDGKMEYKDGKWQLK